MIASLIHLATLSSVFIIVCFLLSVLLLIVRDGLALLLESRLVLVGFLLRIRKQKVRLIELALQCILLTLLALDLFLELQALISMTDPSVCVGWTLTSVSCFCKPDILLSSSLAFLSALS